MLTPNEFYRLNWGTMTEQEKAAWLYTFVIVPEKDKNIFAGEDAHFYYSNGKSFEVKAIDANLIHTCEKSLSDDGMSLYLANCLQSVGSKIYDGMSQAEITKQETAVRYHRKLLCIDLELRAECLQWAVINEKLNKEE